jgi:hypothetical protein
MIDTITFKTEDIKLFCKLCDYVVSDKLDLYPILNYIKVEIVFGVCILTKSNHSQFVQYQFDTDFDDSEFLLLESELKNFSSTSNSKSFTASLDVSNPGSVSLNDGYYNYDFNNSISSGDRILGIDMFPKIPEQKTETIKITKDMISYTNIAKEFASDDVTLPHFMNIYIKENEVFASDARESFFYKKLHGSFPLIALSKKECILLNNFEYAEYYNSDNFNCFVYGSAIYGFINKENQSGYEISQFKTFDKSKYLRIKTSDFINFCNACVKFSKSKSEKIVSTVSRFMYKDSLTISYSNDNKELKVPVNCESFGITELDFHFNPTTLLNKVSSMPFEYICISFLANKFYLFSEQDADLFSLHITQNPVVLNTDKNL